MARRDGLSQEGATGDCVAWNGRESLVESQPPPFTLSRPSQARPALLEQGLAPPSAFRRPTAVPRGSTSWRCCPRPTFPQTIRLAPVAKPFPRWGRGESSAGEVEPFYRAIVILPISSALLSTCPARVAV